MGIKFQFNPIHFLRGFQGFFALMVLGLLSHVAQWYNSNTSDNSNEGAITHVPTQVVFAIFVSVFTLLITLPYVILTPRFFPHLFGNHTTQSILVLESVSMVFWFSGFVAVAAFLGRLSVCRGDVCTAAKVGTGFAAVSWISFGVTSLFALRYCLGFTGTDSENAGIKKGERTRERVLRGLKLHSVWTGHGRQKEESSVHKWDPNTNRI